MNEKNNCNEFDWNFIRGFLAVIDKGSLVAAAQSLCVSQPTLGRQIDALEQSLGVTLFERGRKGAVPTVAALEIVEHAREIEAATHALSLTALGSASGLTGTVRITASQVVSTYLLPNILKKLLEEAPSISIELVASDRVESLTRREADIAIRMVRPAEQRLIARKVNQISLSAYAHQAYIDKYGTPSRTGDSVNHCVIGYDTDTQIIQGFAQNGLEVDRDFFRFRSDDQVVGLQALRAGMGIGFAPDYFACHHPELIKILPDVEIPTLPVWLVTHREINTNRRIRMVFDFLAEELDRLETDFIG